MMSCSLVAVTLLVISSDAYNPNGVRKHTHMARHYIRPTTEFFSTEDLFSKPITAKDFDETAVRKFRRKLETFRDAGEFAGESFGERIQKRTYKIDPYGWEQQKQETVRRPPLKLVYYEILGLDSEATASEIKRSYRQMAKLFHPDANPHKDTTAHFTLLNRAYEVLTNPRLKERYDRYGRRGIGTSAASDVIHANGIPPTKKKSYPAYQVAKSDSADVCWKGSGTSRFLDLQPKRSQTTLFQAMNKNLIPPAAAPVRSRKPMRDLYSILGVKRQATQDEIRLAYQSLRELFDPETDKSREVYVRYHELTRAYEILKNHDWRTKYDKYGFRALDTIRTMEERVTIPTEMDPDSPYSSNHVPHYTLHESGTNETNPVVVTGPVVASSTRTVVATRPDADYEGASWMTTPKSAEESSGKKVFRVYRQIDPLPLEETYSYRPASSGPIPIIEIEDDNEWDDSLTSPIILPPSSTNNYEDDLISTEDVFARETPFPNLSGGQSEKKGASTIPMATSHGIPNNGSPNGSLPQITTKPVVATRPSAAYQGKTNSGESTKPALTQPIAHGNGEETSRVYRVYQQIDPLPLDQTYNFRPVAKAKIPIIEVHLDPSDEEWNEVPSEPIMLALASKSSSTKPPRQSSMAASPKTTSTPPMMSRRTPINATPTLLAPKVTRTPIKPSGSQKDSRKDMSSPKVEEPPRWSSYSYTKTSLQGRSVEAIIRSPNLPSNSEKAAPNRQGPPPDHTNPLHKKADTVPESRKTVVATRPTAAYQPKPNTGQSTFSTPTKPLSGDDEGANRVYRVYRQIDPLPLDQTYNFRPVAKATIPIIEVHLDPSDEEWNEISSEPIMLAPASKSSTAKPQRQPSMAASPKTTSTPPMMSRRTPINATPTLLAPKVTRPPIKPSSSEKDSKIPLPPPKVEEPPRWSSYSYTKASLKGRSVEAIIRSPDVPSDLEDIEPKRLQSDLQRANPLHSKPNDIPASRKAVVATRPTAAYQAKTTSWSSTKSTASKSEETSKVYRVYRQIDPLPLDQTYNFRPVAKATIPIIEVHLDLSDEDKNEISSEPIMLPAVSKSSTTSKPQAPAMISKSTRTVSTPPIVSRRAPIDASPTMLAHIVNKPSLNPVSAERQSGSPTESQDLVTALDSSNSTNVVHQSQSIDQKLLNTSDLSSISNGEPHRRVETKGEPKDKANNLFFVKMTENNMLKNPINAKVSSTAKSTVAKPDQENVAARQRNLADEAIPAMKHGATLQNKRDKQGFQHPPNPCHVDVRPNDDPESTMNSLQSEISHDVAEVSDSILMEGLTYEPSDENKENAYVNQTNKDCIHNVAYDASRPSQSSSMEWNSSQNWTDTQPPILDQEFTKVRTIPRQIDPLPIDETFGPKGTVMARRAVAHATSVLLTSDQDRSPSRYTLASHNAPDGLLGIQLAAILGVHAPGHHEKAKSPTSSRRPVTRLKATRQQIPEKTLSEKKASNAPQDVTPIQKSTAETEKPSKSVTPFSSHKYIVDSES